MHIHRKKTNALFNICKQQPLHHKTIAPCQGWAPNQSFQCELRKSKAIEMGAK